jgi:hypothetical protein
MVDLMWFRGHAARLNPRAMYNRPGLRSARLAFHRNCRGGQPGLHLACDLSLARVPRRYMPDTMQKIRPR